MATVNKHLDPAGLKTVFSIVKEKIAENNSTTLEEAVEAAKTYVDGKGYQTQSQVETITAAEVAKIVDGAPEAFDTLRELADALNPDKSGSVVAGLVDSIGKKADKDSVYTKTEADGKYATKATTLAGYGITDAKLSDDGVITLGSKTIKPITSHQDLSEYAKTADIPVLSAYTEAEIKEIAAEAFG